jgi:RsiW-degrading membrane proteinase PrsW (M82 family)
VSALDTSFTLIVVAFAMAMILLWFAPSGARFGRKLAFKP